MPKKTTPTNIYADPERLTEAGRQGAHRFRPGRTGGGTPRGGTASATSERFARDLLDAAHRADQPGGSLFEADEALLREFSDTPGTPRLTKSIPNIKQLEKIAREGTPARRMRTTLSEEAVADLRRIAETPTGRAGRMLGRAAGPAGAAASVLLTPTETAAEGDRGFMGPGSPTPLSTRVWEAVPAALMAGQEGALLGAVGGPVGMAAGAAWEGMNALRDALMPEMASLTDRDQEAIAPWVSSPEYMDAWDRVNTMMMQDRQFRPSDIFTKTMEAEAGDPAAAMWLRENLGVEPSLEEAYGLVRFHGLTTAAENAEMGRQMTGELFMPEQQPEMGGE